MKQVSANCDKSLIGRLYTQHYQDLKQYLMGYTHDEMDAEDMIQNLFIKVMTLDVLTPETAKSLLFVMASRMIIDDARHRAFVRQLHENVKLTMNAMETSVFERVSCKQIEELEEGRLLCMAPQRAKVYRMWRHEDLSAAEIAERMQLSRRTVENHLYLSRIEMREFMRKAI